MLYVAPQPPPTPYIFYGVDPLPQHYVERTAALDALKQAVLGPAQGAGVALTAAASSLTAVEGMGGIGKTVLAQALARDPASKERFPNGVLWARLTPKVEKEGDVENILLRLGSGVGSR